MPDLNDRAYRLNVGGTQIDALSGVRAGSLRIAFSVERTERRTPNACEVRVWNLNQGHREALNSAASVTVKLEAGYVGSVGTVFFGDLRTARTHREGPDLITTVAGGDGESAIRTARINRTFPAGTPVSEVLRALASSLGVGTGNSADAAARLTAKLSRGQTLSGLTYDELEAFCRTQGLRWSIQDSQIQIREGDAPVGSTTGPLLRADSGLIGTPVKESAKRNRAGQLTSGVTVSGTCLLRADVVPGRAVRVESEIYSGNLVVIQTTHRGDSHGGDWCVDFVGRPF